MANDLTGIVMGLTVAAVAWIVATRWPRDWMRLIVVEAIVCAAIGALLGPLVLRKVSDGRTCQIRLEFSRRTFPLMEMEQREDARARDRLPELRQGLRAAVWSPVSSCSSGFLVSLEEARCGLPDNRVKPRRSSPRR